MLSLRWNTLRIQLGLPHRIVQETIERVSVFAEAELGELALHGGSGMNAGLPLTSNQKQRQEAIKESEKKRAAAAKERPASQILV